MIDVKGSRHGSADSARMNRGSESGGSSPGRHTDGPGRDAGTASCVRFLREPATHGGGFEAVEVKETSKSWVFLTPHDVYKLKKPIENHFQDLRSLAAREANCRIEVRLNRRLAREIYLGVVPITREASGGLALAGEGDVVDWLVHMRRLPADRMLDQIILNGEADEQETRDRLARLANSLVEFYRDAPVAGLTGQDYVQLFEQEQAKNRAVLKEPRFARDLGSLDDLLARFDDSLAAVRGELEQRVRDGRIVDGHGDLRPEHVCLVDPPVVIDCLEFSERLRMIDPFDELVYLGLECAVIGAPTIRGDLIERCAAGLGDRPSVGVLRLYEAYRALLRARQSLAHLLVPAPRDPAKWMPMARGYIGVAERALLTR